MNSIDEIRAIDLIDIKAISKNNNAILHAISKNNNAIKYLLTVIDIFSKFDGIVPLKRKTEQEVANALSMILKERRSSQMWVDKGREFYNEDVQKLLELYSTENEDKSCVNEVFNRTIKENFVKYFSTNSTRTFVDVLDLLVDQCSNAIHSSINMTPRKHVVKKTKISVEKFMSRIWW